MGHLAITQNTEDRQRECEGTCHGCTRAHRAKEQRTATATIAASIDEVIALLEHHNLKAAESYAMRLLEIIEELPASTAALVGPKGMTQLRVHVQHGLLEIRTAAQLQALGTFRSALRSWFDSYPPHRA